jgi:N-acetyl-gamma-glutamyl-phosphate reductase
MLINHPIFNLNYVANSEGENSLDNLHLALKNISDLEVKKANPQEAAKNCELVFLALPHKTAMAFVKPLIQNGVKVVDLSADYRLPIDIYEKYYTTHTDKENIKNSAYGLPELFRQKIKKAKIVANPGCFPTSAILGALPFLKYRVKNTPLIVDAKTGVSGAGKKLSDTTHFVHINENLFAYNPLSHRHSPEIADKLGLKEEEVNFIPHLCPVTRGMLSSIYMQVNDDFNPIKVLEKYYQNEPFIRIFDKPVDMKNVAGTNFCDIYAKKKNNLLFISSAIDNLQRGASSQAVVNANIMMGLDEETGIPKIAYVP